MNKDIKIGTLVKLDPKSRWAYDGNGGESNPIDVIGVVIPNHEYRDVVPGWTWVKWPNNIDNCYPDEEDCLFEVEE
ncbi:hypothetical protein F485_gp150 [Aeromonas phage CC2]|uniref:Uncharacterized protein n=1 Tax=Aeromonas phage CC2 TaxID=1204516 RepID=I6XGP1_9CAUD|nr:hypothetical protein F485_gp150 [Aeromonas phage CC2]AFN39236.1 hypothetical protein CC2_147 [Aeromonas phage CC2]